MADGGHLFYALLCDETRHWPYKKERVEYLIPAVVIAYYYGGAVVGGLPVRAEPFAIVDFRSAFRLPQASKDRHEDAHAHTCSVND